MSPPKTAKSKRLRCHNFMLVEQTKFLPAKHNTLDAMLDLVKRQNPDSYGGILQDKDNGEAPHLHIFMHFSNARDLSALAKKLHVAPQYLAKWDENVESGYLYLTHRTPAAKAAGKYQYDPSEVNASFDYVSWLQATEAKAAKQAALTAHAGAPNDVKYLLDCLYAGAMTREDVEARLSGSQYGRVKRQIDDICAKRLQSLSDKWRAEMRRDKKQVEVIWIYGPAGAGKTRWAKEQAERRYHDYFVTGSSRDPFARYQGQPCAIYDEARPNDIQFSDLLKILDPFSVDTSAPSRYYDKPLAVSTYYITTPYSPTEFYNEIFTRATTDSFEQLLRRLTIVVQINDTTIQAMQYDPQRMTFLPIPGTSRPNPYSTASTQSAPDPITLFNSFFI